MMKERNVFGKEDNIYKTRCDKKRMTQYINKHTQTNSRAQVTEDDLMASKVIEEGRNND